MASDTLLPAPGGFQPRVSAQVGFPVHTIPVIWLTDIDVATPDDAELIGLGPNTGLLSCDRIEYRFKVPTGSGEWWPAWVKRQLADGPKPEWGLDEAKVALLGLDRAPERWWVSDRPIRSPHLDDRYRPPAVARSTPRERFL